jgi:hypothetical protein
VKRNEKKWKIGWHYIRRKNLFVKLPKSKFFLAILRVSPIFHPA